MESAKKKKTKREAYEKWARSLGDHGPGFLAAGPVRPEVGPGALRAARHMVGAMGQPDDVYSLAVKLEALAEAEARRTARSRTGRRTG